MIKEFVKICVDNFGENESFEECNIVDKVVVEFVVERVIINFFFEMVN